MFIPKKNKYQKNQSGKQLKQISKLSTIFRFQELSLKSVTFGLIKSSELDSIYSILNRMLKKLGKIKIFLFAHHAISKKPAEIRMGKGKGFTSYWVSKVKAGKIICKIETCNKIRALQVLKLIKSRLSIKTKLC